jgi:hypothetical protein
MLFTAPVSEKRSYENLVAASMRIKYREFFFNDTREPNPTNDSQDQKNVEIH